MEQFERIVSGDAPLAFIIRAQTYLDKTTFVTPPDLNFQIGFIVYGKNEEIKRHVHKPLQRVVSGSSELLILKKGRCLVDIYNDGRELVATRELNVGDVLLLLSGGHGFRLLEDTVFLEIKQGPYVGVAEKERF